MSFYSRVIFPRLCNFALGNSYVSVQRRRVLAEARGEILELGFGTGLNLPHYPPEVRKIKTVDPNPGMHRLAQRRIEKSSIAVDFRQLSGERLPFESDSFDCVVSTYTLCSIDNVDQALSEAFRVLKPGCKFLFLEHGISPEPNVSKWQQRLNGLQGWIGDGCRLNRNIKQLISSQPFAAVDSEEFYLEQTPKLLGYLYRGAATK